MDKKVLDDYMANELPRELELLKNPRLVATIESLLADNKRLEGELELTDLTKKNLDRWRKRAEAAEQSNTTLQEQVRGLREAIRKYFASFDTSLLHLRRRELKEALTNQENTNTEQEGK